MSEPTVVSLVHLGCARNLIDSEVLLARLAEAGAVVSGEVAGADVAVLNTCSFIGLAREESEGALRELIEQKRAGDLRGVVVAGCMVQRYRRALETRYPDVDLFAEISDYRRLAGEVVRLSRGERGVPRYLSSEGQRPAEREGSRLLSTPGSYAYLRISHGCDHTCSFCAIPSIRGTHRSKPLTAVTDEARELLDAGVRELVLVAEDSTAWGRDLGADLGLELPDLVEALAELDGDHRVRVMYAYPNRFPWGLTRLLREHPRVARYLDMPIQHVSTPVLRAMRRAGDGEQVRRLLDRLHEEVPGLTLRTTVLVGFPGETDEDVAALVDLLREYRLGRMGAFTYSREEGTAAHDLGEGVSADVAEARYRSVCAARDEVLAAEQAALVGDEVEVLVDECHATRAVARTELDAPEVDLLAVVEGDPERSGVQVGERLAVRVTGVDEAHNLVCTREGSIRTDEGSAA